ncbi:cbb3-type cytochrome c oxidase subunit II [Microaerobacter geothermalis]|uniref:cbb3-type cytochrome c oxidase subunit II n=1 Tax=Microaerobacter geothermalis TaxID=674972 RepID=UPI001F3E9B08|nr:cbb3-type cytochrome c oxidase subunit II [Microaerobacter geothermalis]MCF6092601.1 cbb3-type cytochrome c oxidase subunit II [Microaerobacter geothermalis]
MANNHEQSMFPFILGSLLLFLIGVIGTVLLPFYDASMQEPNINADARNYDFNTAEYRGRQIYIREGCHTCHTQYVRPVKADTALGPVTVPQDYYYDKPHLLGSVRTGSDLMWVGARWNEEWHRRHLLNPREMLPGSIMPRYDYLSDAELDDLITYLMSLKPASQAQGR